MTVLKYYKLPSIKGEGWAHITINTETGFFATVSDWGNYSFIWTSPGGEFRAFLTQLQPDYLYGKLMMGRPDNKVFDGKKTVANIRQELEDLNKEDGGWEHYAAEMAALKEIGPDPEKSEFEGWEGETRLTDVWEHVVYVPAPDCMGFCERVFPRFVALLKAELEQEAGVQRMTGAERNG
jgi:hypothetical protein